MNTQQKQIIVNHISYSALLGPEEAIDNKANLINDLGIDSLDLIDIVIKVEADLDITIKDSDIEGMKTVQDIYDVVEKYIKDEN